MDHWLKPALDYIPQWLEYQLRETEQPGCVIAVVHKGQIVLERAFGYADLVGRVPLTPAPFPGGLPFEELYCRRHHEAA